MRLALRSLRFGTRLCVRMCVCVCVCVFSHVFVHVLLSSATIYNTYLSNTYESAWTLSSDICINRTSHLSLLLSSRWFLSGKRPFPQDEFRFSQILFKMFMNRVRREGSDTASPGVRKHELGGKGNGARGRGDEKLSRGALVRPKSLRSRTLRSESRRFPYPVSHGAVNLARTQIKFLARGAAGTEGVCDQPTIGNFTNGDAVNGPETPNRRFD